MPAKLLQSCPLCDAMVCSLSGSSIRGILQARILEWVAMLSSRRSSWPRDRTCTSYMSCIDRQVLTTSATWETPHKMWKWKWTRSVVSHSVTPWTVAHQAPRSMGFSRQEYWSGLPFSSPGDLPHPGIEPRSLALRADALTSEPPRKP